MSNFNLNGDVDRETRLGATSADHGGQMGADASIHLGAGIGTVTETKKENCECE